MAALLADLGEGFRQSLQVVVKGWDAFDACQEVEGNLCDRQEQISTTTMLLLMQAHANDALADHSTP